MDKVTVTPGDVILFLDEAFRNSEKDGFSFAEIEEVLVAMQTTFDRLVAHQSPAPDSEKLREALDFNRGYMLAVANLMNLHGSEVEATDVLRELGASRADMEALDLTDYDIIPLRRLFTEIERRAALRASS